MHGDFSRNTFRPNELFTRVLMQQGRVQLDADWNELMSVLLHWQRELAKDVLGPDPTITMANRMPLWHGILANIANMALVQDFLIHVEAAEVRIGNGRYYVDGILCENGAPDDDLPYLKYDDQVESADSDPLTQEGKYLLYLDAWERFVTPGEDDYVIEKALLGADTAARARIVWQVKAKKYAGDDDGTLPLVLAHPP